LEIDDLLVAYTDGITEVGNRDGEFWGQQRLEDLLPSNSGLTSEQAIKCILDEVSSFPDGQQQLRHKARHKMRSSRLAAIGGRVELVRWDELSCPAERTGTRVRAFGSPRAPFIFFDFHDE
jgi:hypothetical protein